MEEQCSDRSRSREGRHTSSTSSGHRHHHSARERSGKDDRDKVGTSFSYEAKNRDSYRSSDSEKHGRIYTYGESKRHSRTSNFLKPGDSTGSTSSYLPNRFSNAGGWKRKDFVKPVVVDENPNVEYIQDEQTELTENEPESDASTSATQPSEVSSGSQSSKSVMSDDELNKLGAKILRAEMMGNTELASKLKQQKAEAHKALEAKPVENERKPEDDDDDGDSQYARRMSEKDRKHRHETDKPKKASKKQRRFEQSVDKCHLCFESLGLKKHLVMAVGIRCYLCLPEHKSLSSGHCIIVPMQHVVSSVEVDDDVWSEIQIFRKGLTKMFEDIDQDSIFIETCVSPKFQHHMSIECIPVPREKVDIAPMYFKKALMECETEWSQNKKVIDLTSEKDIRRAVPKGFPYFSVMFGLGNGFAHVIEDNRRFPHYFGKEVVGGILNSEPRLWLNPPKENFDDQRKKAVQFAGWWKPYDWTHRIRQDS